MTLLVKSAHYNNIGKIQEILGNEKAYSISSHLKKSTKFLLIA